MEKSIDVKITQRAEEYLDGLEESTRRKFTKAFRKVEIRQFGEHFKKLAGTDNIFEFRVTDKGKWFRILAFPAASAGAIMVMVTTHGFQKKGNKTPKKEIDIAVAIRNNWRMQAAS